MEMIGVFVYLVVCAIGFILIIGTIAIFLDAFLGFLKAAPRIATALEKLVELQSGKIDEEE